MSLPKEKYRELLFQVLYGHHFSEESMDADPTFFMHQLKTTRKNVLMAIDEAKQIVQQKEALDQEIKEASTSYDISRIQTVELNILRLCLYEMKKDLALDKAILISEGVRLAKKFSTTQSITFINGVLEQLYKNNTSPAYTAEV